MITFKQRVEAKYSLTERLQTLQKPRSVPPPYVLFAYSFPLDVWKKTKEEIGVVLRGAGIKYDEPKSRDPHISVALVHEKNVSDEQRQEFLKVARQLVSTFKVIGVEVLKGKNTPLGYISLVLDVPQGYREAFQWCRKTFGKDAVLDHREFFKDLKPHVSVWTVAKEDVEKVRKLKLEASAKKIAPFKPQFALTFDNFQISEWEVLSE